MGCIHTAEFLELEREALKEEIDKHKWYLSEMANGDVGYTFAQLDFLEHFIKTWGEDFRRNYCQNVCIDKTLCDCVADAAA